MASGKVFQSKKVGQTLQDLEAAFADWDALGNTQAKPDEPAAPVDTELREKTKKLLNQLREQLKELGE